MKHARCSTPDCTGERAVMRDGRNHSTYESSACLDCQPDPHPDRSIPWARSAPGFHDAAPTDAVSAVDDPGDPNFYVIEIEGMPAEPGDDWPDDVEDLM